jgi:DNA-binding NtrC family response regulator
MSARLLVIENAQRQVHLMDLLRREWNYCGEQIFWDSFQTEQISSASPDLLIPIVMKRDSGVEAFFNWVSASTRKTKNLIVFPKNVEEDILKAAVEISDDFLLWPVENVELHQRVLRALWSKEFEASQVSGKLTREWGLEQLIGTEPAFVRIVETLPQIAASEMPVLITGETGTGKDLFARAIHHLSGRSRYPFIPADCGALPGHLFENELFGHVRGAFTDARTNQKGLVAMAEGGTLFLDEIDALSMEAQTKLLRFLQDRTYKQLGAETFSRAKVQIIAATNQNLDQLIVENRFRSDLFFRLSVLEIDLPPLRRRRGDIKQLAQHCLARINSSTKNAAKSFSPAALRKLTLHYWPGNIRELFNVVQRAFVLCQSNVILPRHLVIRSSQLGWQPDESFIQAKKRVVEAFERKYLHTLLYESGGNISLAARTAGKERRAFGRLVKKYGIDPRRYRDSSQGVRS